MNLSELKNNETAFVSAVGGSKAFCLRLEEMGFVPGQEVTRLYASPLGSPVVFAMLGQKVALRLSEARQIEARKKIEDVLPVVSEIVESESDAEYRSGSILSCSPAQCSACPGCGGRQKHLRRRSERNSQQHVPDLTIALVGNPNCGKTAFFNAASGGHERTGNYAGVTVSSVEGQTIFDGCRLCIIDLPGTYSLQAFSPEEAYVANELRKGEIDVVVNVLDVNNLERNLLLTTQLLETGLPMVGALNMYDEFEESGSVLNIPELERRLRMPLVPTVANQKGGIDNVLRTAINMGREADATQEKTSFRKRTLSVNQSVAGEYDTHAFIHRLLDGIYTLREGRAVRLTTILDRFFARTPLAYLLFFLLMGIIFYATFELGAYPMEWMESGIGWISQYISAGMSEGWVRDLFIDGIIGGVGSVIVFLPNILILYFFISILEDSGYLARAALLADPLLRRVGLHGKSFIPMLMGFGCNVPAIMATRTIESHKSRLITMMTLPFMSCSARLPVYVVFTGAFFAGQATWVMLALYFGGILVAFAAAWLLNRYFHREEESHFIMEMPPYRKPILRSVLRHTWEKGRQYLHKMGGIILLASIVVWALGYFPQPKEDLAPSVRQEQSYLGQLGHTIQSAIEPLGYDWRMGVGILSGIGAKELMVSTLGVLYNGEENGLEDLSETRLMATLHNSGITSAAALSYLVFALLYFPCLATIAAIRAESRQWKYALFTVFYTTIVAYTIAFVVYKLALWMF